MIVYANEFYFESNDNGLDCAKDAIKRWLGRKIGPEFKPIRIIPFAKPFKTVRTDTATNEVMIIGTPDQAEDYSLSITYRHNDRDVHGRAWFTRIGIERAAQGEPLRVTILLETQEVSPQAALHPVTPSQPGVVQELLQRCRLHPATPGAAMSDGYECTHNGVKYSLLKHIGLGTSRDPRYCFRLYFEWDDKAQRIIVLHAGRHLDTQST